MDGPMARLMVLREVMVSLLNFVGCAQAQKSFLAKA
jgi:hypothetical protein